MKKQQPYAALSTPFDINEYFKIKRKIQECDTFYASLYELAEVAYSNQIDTAAIQFDSRGNALHMLINPQFWNGLQEDEKTFVILHELCHTIYDHAKRFIALGADFQLGNIASDIVINHKIHESFGIDREKFQWQKYCWVETCFPKHPKGTIASNKNAEFYYHLLAQEQQKNSLDNKPQLLGSHPQQEQPSAEQDARKNNKKEKKSTADFSDTFKDIIEQNPHLRDEMENCHDLDIDALKSELNNHAPIIAPKSNRRHSGEQAQVNLLDEKPNFSKLMKILVPKKTSYEENEAQAWVGTHRRYASFLKQNKNMRLPNTIIQSKQPKNKEKKQVWIFMDSSGSCHSMFHTFSTIVLALLKEKNLQCRAFAFGDDCSEVDAKNHRISFYSGNDGGFDCIEEKIISLMKTEKCNYPDNVVVLSDGGVEFHSKNNLLKPNNWILLINNNSSKHLLPPGGKYFHITKEFFQLNKESSISQDSYPKKMKM